jgi:alpha-amylase/alpha-mannosidase (GH57 family)
MNMKKRLFVCIHGHFYQPPRENPWLEEVEMQDEAFPYHDWNERITAECYDTNAHSRILDKDKKIIGIVNNYSKISFNFGPTLLSWMQKKAPAVYNAVLEADRESRQQFSGHGCALAQAYNHVIMPLANRRDKITQIHWGLEDFKYRFGRDAEGIWLPETAVDIETLEILAEKGLRFTILSPHQACRIRKIDETDWTEIKDESIDFRTPYRCVLPSGRSLTIFFYNGALSHELSFGDLIKDGKRYADSLVSLFLAKEEKPQLVHVATDGENYGHHHRFGDMALAYCLYDIESNARARITVYGEYLEKFPPTHDVEIFENKSWSCSHGVERWRKNCGCHLGKHPEWNQEWRAPLREAMDWLRDHLVIVFEREASPYLKDPWLARDDYISLILDRSKDSLTHFFQLHARKSLRIEERERVLKLLEMQRHAILMYTSCGWFHDDIAGIESLQVLRYAARAIQLTEELTGQSPEPEYCRILERARSNYSDMGNGRQIYNRYVLPARINLLDVGMHFALYSMFEGHAKRTEIYGHTVNFLKYEKLKAGRMKLATGQIRVVSNITGVGSHLSFAILHMGDHNLNGGVCEHMDDGAYARMHAEIQEAFEKSDIPGVIRLMDKHFGMNNYSLHHLFKDEQRRVMDQILSSAIGEIESSLLAEYEDYFPIMQATSEMGVPLPKAFRVTGQYILNRKLRELLESEEIRREELLQLVKDIRRFSFGIDRTEIGWAASKKITLVMEQFLERTPDIDQLEHTVEIIKIIRSLPIDLDIGQAQNMYFSMCKKLSEIVVPDRGKEAAGKWEQIFRVLGSQLDVRFM